MFEPIIPTGDEQFVFESWIRDESYRFYVQTRRNVCNFRELLDIWLRAPYCESCAHADPIYWSSRPDISPRTWEVDVTWILGEERLNILKSEIRADADYSLSCKRCHTELRPWSHDYIWVVRYHLEEHYNIPIEVKNKQASRKLRNTIFNLYGKSCFGCGSKTYLHLDHILPRSKGGTAAFRNLQPLCEVCGQAKGDDIPDEVGFFYDIYFERPPSDGYEGLFW